MNIQTGKLNLIEEFLRISDEKIIEKLESLLKIENKKLHDRELEPRSLKDYHDIIDRAKKDKAEGRLVSHEELKKRIKSWK